MFLNWIQKLFLCSGCWSKNCHAETPRLIRTCSASWEGFPASLYLQCFENVENSPWNSPKTLESIPKFYIFIKFINLLILVYKINYLTRLNLLWLQLFMRTPCSTGNKGEKMTIIKLSWGSQGRGHPGGTGGGFAPSSTGRWQQVTTGDGFAWWVWGWGEVGKLFIYLFIAAIALFIEFFFWKKKIPRSYCFIYLLILKCYLFTYLFVLKSYCSIYLFIYLKVFLLSLFNNFFKKFQGPTSSFIYLFVSRAFCFLYLIISLKKLF